LPAEPSSATVYRDPAGRWWASFVVRFGVPAAPVEPTGRSTGLDVGLSRFVTTEHPANDVANPRFARQAAKALARSQRNQARKQPGSAQRSKARRRTARVAAKVAAQRADFAHKTARGVLAAYDRIGVEDLAAKNMSRRGKGRRKAGLNRAIADAGWGQFRQVLEWQAAKAGKTVVVFPAAGTTQTCSDCRAKAKPRVELSDRVFRCRACGLVLDRDRNAARNLNPDRRCPDGGAEPSVSNTGGNDGHKTDVPEGTEAASAPESGPFRAPSSQCDLV
jgi:putative transposase